MFSHFDSYLSSYVREAIVDLAEFDDRPNCWNEENLIEKIDVKQFVTDVILIKWDEIHQLFGHLPDDFNILEQSTKWYSLMLKKVWMVVNNVGKALINATPKQRSGLWKLCENLEPFVDLEKCFVKFLSDSVCSKFQVLLILTSSLERFLGNVFLIEGQNVPFLLRDLLMTEELLRIFGRIPITFTQLLVGCPRGMNLRNVAWHGFLSFSEIHPYLVASLFVLFASLNVMVEELRLTVPVRSPVNLNLHCDLLKEVFPNLDEHIAEVTDTILNKAPFIPNSHKIFWQEALNYYKNASYGECLIILLPQLEHLLRIIYCAVNSCPNRLLTAEATDLYTTLDEILAPSTEDCPNQMIQFLDSNLTEILEDIFCYPEGPRVRDKISHGEFNLFDEHNSCITKILCNHVCCVALSVVFTASQKLKLCICCSRESSSFIENKERDHENACKCNEVTTNNMKSLEFLEQSITTYKSQFHPVSYLLRSVSKELNKLMLWNQLPRPDEHTYMAESVSYVANVSRLKSLIINKTFNDEELDLNEFCSKLMYYLQGIDCLTLHRPRSEGIVVTLMRHIMDKIRQLNSVVENVNNIKYKQWNEHKMRSRTRVVYQTMLQFLPSLQNTLLCITFIVLLETNSVNQLQSNFQEINRFLKYTLKYIENTLSYCSLDKNQWQQVIKLTSEFSVVAYDYLDRRLKRND